MTLPTSKDAIPARTTRARAMASFVASWPAVGAWGAGLVQAALGAAAVVAPGATFPAQALGIALVAYGLAAIGWGVLSLRAERMLAPRAVVALAVTGLVADGILLSLAPARTSVVGVAVAALLGIAIAAPAADATRSPRREARPVGVWGILLAAAVIAVLVTPALGAVQDAVLLRDDGTLPAITHDGH